MQEALAGLNDGHQRSSVSRSANRIGVNTGEVVAGDPTHRPATRDRRPGQHGRPARTGGGPRRGAPRRADVPPRPRARRGRGRRAAGAEGKAERSRPSGCWPCTSGAAGARALRRSSDASARPSGSRRRFERAVDARAAAAADHGRRGRRQVPARRATSAQRPPSSALVIRGRCLSYGDGITFWPLVEALREAVGYRGRRRARGSARTKLAALMRRARRGLRAARLGVGLSDRQYPLPEVFWRRASSSRPLSAAAARARLRGPPLGGAGAPRSRSTTWSTAA